MLRVIVRSCLLGGLVLAAAAGCGGSAAIRAAEGGRLGELQRLLAEEIARGDLDDDDARDIARAVAEGEVQRARPPEGAARLLGLRICARSVEGPLRERAAGSDAIAPVAALLLLDAGLADVEETRRHAAGLTRPSSAAAAAVASAWRAVHARTLVGVGDVPARRERMLDGDQEVRVAALRASIEAADPGDREAVLEAARLDPLPLARTLAIRAAAASGGERVVRALRDLWTLADEPAREAIAEAWASPRAVSAGGHQQLLWAISTQRGAPAIAAARALAHAGREGSAEALGVLVRAIESGPTRDRVYAIRVIPLGDAAARAAVARATGDPDPSVALAALTRQLDAAPTGSEWVAATKRLLALAEGSTTHALLAKGALARAGVPSIAPILQRDVRSRDSLLRESAGEGLIALGQRVRAAPLLADPDPQVRISVACALLTGRP